MRKGHLHPGLEFSVQHALNISRLEKLRNMQTSVSTTTFLSWPFVMMINAQAIDSDSETPLDGDCRHGDLQQRIKSEIGSLTTSFVSVEQVRLSVRRKNIWDDLKKAARKRIGPTNNLKIVFLGEPAIDDGGPKREFFSGVGYVQYYFQMSNNYIQPKLCYKKTYNLV